MQNDLNVDEEDEFEWERNCNPGEFRGSFLTELPVKGHALVISRTTPPPQGGCIKKVGERYMYINRKVFLFIRS